MTLPEELRDSGGKWARRDALVSGFAEENDIDVERCEELMDGLIENGPMRSKEIDGTEYVQLTGNLDAAVFIAKAKMRGVVASVTRYVGGGEP